MIKRLLPLVLALHFIPAQAQQDEHPIDRKLGNCLDRNDTTMGMLDCMGTAYTHWDAELNTVYRELMANLPPPAQDALRDAQRRWLAFRDAEFATIDQIYGNRDGTMWRLNSSGARLDLLSRRVKDLIAYRDSLFF